MRGKRMTSKKKQRQLVDGAIFGEALPFAAAEAYRRLRTNIMFALPDEQKCRIVGVTSSVGGEGKSTTSLNLSYMLAEAGERVLLIEADMRLPSISRQLNLSPAPGLSNVLAGLLSAYESIQESGIHERLAFISAGDIPPNPTELLGAKWMQTLMEVLSANYDFIILDLPPITEVSDALVASKYATGMIMVVRQDYATRRVLTDAMQQLEYAGTKILGFVMTRSDTQVKGKYKKYYEKGHESVYSQSAKGASK